MKGLIIQSPHIDRILAGEKTWEIRGSNCKHRGPIALIKSGTNQIVGTCTVAGVEGPLTLQQMEATRQKHHSVRINDGSLPYAKTYAWVLENAKPLSRPVIYTKKPGAVVWVDLSMHPDRETLLAEQTSGNK